MRCAGLLSRAPTGLPPRPRRRPFSGPILGTSEFALRTLAPETEEEDAGGGRAGLVKSFLLIF